MATGGKTPEGTMSAAKGDQSATPDELAELVASITTNLDDVCDALFDENLGVFDAEAASMVALQVSARLMGKAVGTLVQVSNNHEVAARLLMSGLERGVGRSIDRTMVCTSEGRNLVDFVRLVTDRFIEAAAMSLSAAVEAMPTGAHNGNQS